MEQWGRLILQNSTKPLCMCPALGSGGTRCLGASEHHLMVLGIHHCRVEGVVKQNSL